MSLSNNPRRNAGTAALVCHRWFSKGEAWASSDNLAPSTRQKVLDLLQKDLPLFRRVSKETPRYQVDGGVLLVRTSADPECPDMKARQREPVLITAVFVDAVRPRDLQAQDADLLLNQAERLCRCLSTPNEAKGLRLQIPMALSMGIRRRRVMKNALLATLVAVVVGSCVAFAQMGDKVCEFGRTLLSKALETKPTTTDITSGPKDISAWAVATHAQLRRWGIEVPPPQSASLGGDTKSTGINVFLKLLCREGNLPPLQGKHMDVKYLERLPENAAQMGRSPDEEAVRVAMIRLLKVLAGAETPAEHTETADKRSAETVVADIANRMDYRQWYSSQSRTTAFCGTAPELPEQSRKYVYRFCPSASGIEDGSLCAMLYDVLTKQWGVQGITEDDLRLRPWFVAGCFFEFVSLAATPAVSKSDPLPGEPPPSAVVSLESDSAVLARLRRYLPADTLLPRDTLLRDNLDLPVKDALDRLARQLDIPTSGRDARTILEDVRIRLKQVAESMLEASRQDTLPDAMRWYLERLACRGPVRDHAKP